LPAPVDARIAPLFCLLLLTSACGLASFAFACATPFAAFAALAGAMLPLSSALPIVVAAWIVNQAIGFGVLGYPVELNTFLWGWARRRLLLPPRRPWCYGSCRRSAALSNWLLLCLPPMSLMRSSCSLSHRYWGGAGAFTIAIVARIGLLNVLWMIGLVLAYELLRLFVLKHQQFVT
jgi:hypothetical protein